MFRPKRIIIHHSLTSDGAAVSWGAIRRFHTEVRGWKDIGYHAGCELARDQWECLYGRPLTEPGAHTRGLNHDSLGFCFVGNFDESRPPAEALRVAAQRVLVPWLHLFELDLDDIYGHRDFSSKSCPGRFFDLDELRGMVDEVGRNVGGG